MTHIQCKQAYEMMCERQDDVLDEAMAPLLDQHLRVCENCRAEWHRLQVLDQLFKAAPMLEPPVRIRVQVMARLERQQKVRQTVIGFTTLSLGTVTLALLIVAPLLLGLLNVTGIVPLVVQAGPAIVSQMLSFTATMARAFLVILESLAIPLAVAMVLGLAIAVTLNGLWIGTLRRLQVTR
ncbi:MAG TPA: zf-HC2 domain-containing protein [Chloroflexi bacterium]|nr:zf-HC2 domain-containing protein [Chloroflexota bacterium]